MRRQEWSRARLNFEVSSSAPGTLAGRSWSFEAATGLFSTLLQRSPQARVLGPGAPVLVPRPALPNGRKAVEAVDVCVSALA